MEKVIQFSEEQKSLIWSTKVAPVNGTGDEARAFVEVCEEYGLNPLQGDIVFSRYETKYGPRVSYLITRDGLLKHAHRQSDYVSINAGVVRQNDVFEFDVNNEVVIHKFGAERGQVIGAWCVLKTKTRGNILEFADYQEYKNALGSKNDLWNKMPSSMIKKTAQANAIKTAFPLGVNFATEDDVIEYDVQTSSLETNAVNEPVVKEEKTITEELKAAAVQEKAKQKGSSQTSNAKEKAQNQENQSEKTKTENKVEETKEFEKVTESKIKEVQATTEQPVKQSSSQIKPEEEAQTDNSVQTEDKSVMQLSMAQKQTESTIANNDNIYTFVDSVLQISPTKGTKFLRIKATNNGREDMLFAADENIELFDEFVEGIVFEAVIQQEQGFKFVKGVKVLDMVA